MLSDILFLLVATFGLFWAASLASLSTQLGRGNLKTTAIIFSLVLFALSNLALVNI